MLYPPKCIGFTHHISQFYTESHADYDFVIILLIYEYAGGMVHLYYGILSEILYTEHSGNIQYIVYLL